MVLLFYRSPYDMGFMIFSYIPFYIIIIPIIYNTYLYIL